MSKRPIDQDSFGIWFEKTFCPLTWSFDRPTFLGRLFELLAAIICFPLYIILFCTLFPIIETIWRLTYYLAGGSEFKRPKWFCKLGKHHWVKRLTVYNRNHVYVNYCKYCDDCQDLTHPHSKQNKYFK